MSNFTFLAVEFPEIFERAKKARAETKKANRFPDSPSISRLPGGVRQCAVTVSRSSRNMTIVKSV